MVKKNFVNACMGLDEAHIDFNSLEKPLHHEVISVVQQFRYTARQHGFDIGLASGYRSFSQQLAIWNAKATGQRVVLDCDEQEIEREHMSNTEIMFAILHWSALPGASRHHWGTDFDIYDRAAVADNYNVQLTVTETCEGGPFAAMYQWLDEYLENNHNEFVRPFQQGHGGVAQEPWHLSYLPLASKFSAELNRDVLLEQIRAADIALKKEILSNINEIYDRFVQPYLTHE